MRKRSIPADMHCELRDHETLGCLTFQPSLPTTGRGLHNRSRKAIPGRAVSVELCQSHSAAAVDRPVRGRRPREGLGVRTDRRHNAAACILVTYVYPDEGHGLGRPKNRCSIAAVAEAFLASHLGGCLEPVGNDFKDSTIELRVGRELGSKLNRASAPKARSDWFISRAATAELSSASELSILRPLGPKLRSRAQRLRWDFRLGSCR
jgi:hypothetical protein